jgi:hypothetical protein
VQSSSDSVHQLSTDGSDENSFLVLSGLSSFNQMVV